MEALLALRGNLWDCRLYVGVGTNGKVPATLLSQLFEAGLRVGVLPLLILIHYNDQITINGEAISDQDLQTTG